MLSLKNARKTKRLQEFIAAQEEAAVGPIDRAEFDGAVETSIKAPQSKIEHRVPHLAVIRPERKLAQVPVKCLSLIWM